MYPLQTKVPKLQTKVVLAVQQSSTQNLLTLSKDELLEILRGPSIPTTPARVITCAECLTTIQEAPPSSTTY